MLLEKEKVLPLHSREKSLVSERPVVPEVPKQVEAKESVGADLQLKKPVLDDHTGQALLSSAEPQQVKITLPLTNKQLHQALKQRVNFAARWLGEQVMRLVKIKSRKFIYQLPKS